ncbi:MAG: response regulator [Betaproteobacteria bacterium]|jgi:DNA-binding NtrC family response regulator|nr:response regulator [Candidatus Binatia bacterium]
MSADPPPLLLLVDDEVGVRESLKMVFSKSYRLLEADNVDGALAQVRNARPDLVLLDVLMPKTDGIEVLRRIKEIHPDCAVIILTGVNSQQLATKASDFGAFDFIGKPFDVIELRQKVARAIEHVKSQMPPG